MAKQKQLFTTIFCDADHLNSLLFSLSDLPYFKPDLNYQSHIYTKSKDSNQEDIFFTKMEQILTSLQLPALYENEVDTQLGEYKDSQEILHFFETYYQQHKNLNAQITEIKEQNENFGLLLQQLSQLKSLDVELELLFSLSLLKIRFGKLPKKSYRNLVNFEDEDFLFFPLGEDTTHNWGFYFTTEEVADFTDNTLLSMGFERIRIPDYVHGKGAFVFDYFQKILALENSRILQLQQDLQTLKQSHKVPLRRYYDDYKFVQKIHHLKTLIWQKNNHFMLRGIIPSAEKDSFQRLVHQNANIKLIYA